jgi:hypothetical protein
METGVMPFELAKVTLKDIDLDKGTLVVRGFKPKLCSVYSKYQICLNNQQGARDN